MAFGVLLAKIIYNISRADAQYSPGAHSRNRNS